MTTKAEFVKWLDQFPDDAKIECIVTEEYSSHGESVTSVAEAEMQLQPVTDMRSWFEGLTFELEGKYNHETEKSTVTIIRIGKKG